MPRGLVGASFLFFASAGEERDQEIAGTRTLGFAETLRGGRDV